MEQAFGILAKKFNILQRPIQMDHEHLVLVTQSMLLIHNFLRDEALPEEEGIFISLFQWCS